MAPNKCIIIIIIIIRILYRTVIALQVLHVKCCLTVIVLFTSPAFELQYGAQVLREAIFISYNELVQNYT